MRSKAPGAIDQHRYRDRLVAHISGCRCSAHIGLLERFMITPTDRALLAASLTTTNDDEAVSVLAETLADLIARGLIIRNDDDDGWVINPQGQATLDQATQN